MAGSPLKRAKRLAQKKNDWQSVRQGYWQNGLMDSITLADARGGRKLYVRRNSGARVTTGDFYESLREAKAEKRDD
jgi:hypothetical protein